MNKRGVLALITSIVGPFVIFWASHVIKNLKLPIAKIKIDKDLKLPVNVVSIDMNIY